MIDKDTQPNLDFMHELIKYINIEVRDNEFNRKTKLQNQSIQTVKTSINTASESM